MSPMRRKAAIAGYLFYMPAILGAVFLTFGQMAASLGISFTNWNVVSRLEFVGLSNYAKLLSDDPFFGKSIWVTLEYTFGSVLLGNVTALLLAMLLNIPNVRGRVFFRTVFYLPSIVPAVASSLVWTWMFNPDFGLLNLVLHGLGLGKSMWIYAESTAIPSLVMMSAWNCGSMMVIYLAGLSGVPSEMLEAVEIDGGGARAKFLHCTLPMLSPVIFYNTLMGFIAGFMSFTNTYIMTKGGPNNATLFTNYLIYREAFQENKMGYASALAWIVFVVLAMISVALFTSSRKWVYYGDAND